MIQGIVNVDGVLYPPEKAVVSVFDHGFLYGDSVYETIRTYGNRPFLLNRHLDRLFRSAAGIRLKSAWDKERWRKEIDATMKEATYPGEHYIRLILTRGLGDIGLDPGLCPKPTSIILVKPLLPMDPQLFTKGVNVALVSVARNSLAALPPSIKTGNFLNNILAHIEAESHGGFDGIMCNLKGELAEGTISNVFIVKGGTVYTPPKEAGILEGNTRGIIEEICKEGKIPFKFQSIFPGDLRGADEAFLTGTTREVLPVTKCDGKPIGKGVVGKITTLIHQRFQQKVQELMTNEQ